jgi:hypothetical protein
MDPDRIQEAQKYVDPVDPDSDPDPQHCHLYFLMSPSFITISIMINELRKGF